MALIVVLVLLLVCECWSAPYRRNWTPQAMLYLKGAQGHRSIVERSSKDNVDVLPYVTYKQSNDQLKISLPAFRLLLRLVLQGGDDPQDELNKS